VVNLGYEDLICLQTFLGILEKLFRGVWLSASMVWVDQKTVKQFHEAFLLSPY
jgi:hypothetical protein